MHPLLVIEVIKRCQQHQKEGAHIVAHPDVITLLRSKLKNV